jgi:hypothetical protein
MVFAEVSFSTTEVIGLISSVVVAMAVAIGFVFKLLVKNYDTQVASKDKDFERMVADKDKQLADQKSGYERQLVDERSRSLSWKKIAGNAVSIAESGIPSEKRVAQLAAVVGEANSPMTDKEKEDAELQTVRARLVAVTLAAGLPARVAETDTGGGLVPLSAAAAAAAETEPEHEPMTQAENQQLRDDIAGVKDDTAAIREKIDNQPPKEDTP